MGNKGIIDLSVLEGRIRGDPESYEDEFKMQLGHYQALLKLFKLTPQKGCKDFSKLVRFVAAIAEKYPQDTNGFGQDLIELLQTHGDNLESNLRKTLVQALVQLRRKGQIPCMSTLPLFFRLFHCQDKSLRVLLYKHIVTDIKNSTKKGKSQQLSKQMKGFLLNMIQDADETVAKKSLAILTDIWRRQIWRDAHTANVIATAIDHSSSQVMLAAVKFFLGFDVADQDDESDDEDDEIEKRSQVDKDEVYKAHNLGTKTTKKRKMEKIKRMRVSMRKQARKDLADSGEGFAALQLLQDPHKFAEKLLAKVRTGREKFETRIAVIQLVSRTIGIHKLLLLNFYPFMQKYISPQQQDVMPLLAALVQACHDLVPPDALQPVIRQIVDNFVHDRARPEVITVGLKTVREICVRTPLVMTDELLSDLVLYKTFRDKEVSTAARGLISLFRELAPGMLQRKFRGRGAKMDAKVMGYGEVDVKDRIEGAELLEAALENGSDVDSDVDVDDLEIDEEIEGGGIEELEGSGEEEDGSDCEIDGNEVELDSEGLVSCSGDESDEEEEEGGSCKEAGKKRKHEGDSLAALKKKIATLEQSKAAKLTEENEENGKNEDNEENGDEDGENGSEGGSGKAVPIEMERILDEEDFKKIRKLRHKQLVEDMLKKHGLVSAQKKMKLMEAAEEDAEEALRMEELKSRLSEEKVDPFSLMGKKRGKADKSERLAKVLEGRGDRDYGSSQAKKKQKTGGRSNKEKAKRMSLPLAARMAQAKNRRNNKARKNNPKNFKGHVRKERKSKRR